MLPKDLPLPIPLFPDPPLLHYPSPCILLHQSSPPVPHSGFSTTRCSLLRFSDLSSSPRVSPPPSGRVPLDSFSDGYGLQQRPRNDSVSCFWQSSTSPRLLVARPFFRVKVPPHPLSLPPFPQRFSRAYGPSRPIFTRSPFSPPIPPLLSLPRYLLHQSPLQTSTSHIEGPVKNARLFL